MRSLAEIAVKTRLLFRLRSIPTIRPDSKGL
jgi:hypothetical protein